MTAWLEAAGKGKTVNYKLRDWLFARQRYWGEPFPIVWVDGEPRPLPEEQLPLPCPETKNFKPSGSGESPLANLEDWLQATDLSPANRRGARRTPCRRGRLLLVLPAVHRPEEFPSDG